MEQVQVFNGNGQIMTKDLPRILLQTEYFNDTALAHIEKNTGLKLTPVFGGYEAQPESSDQLVRLFLTYNFKTRYYDNWTWKNTLVLRNDHHVGFEVTSICKSCAEHNHIGNASQLKETDRLSC